MKCGFVFCIITANAAVQVYLLDFIHGHGKSVNSTYKFNVTFNFQLTILKKSDLTERVRGVHLPEDFKPLALEGWIAVPIPVTVGCVCTADEQY